MPERFRAVRDRIGLRMGGWLEQPEEGLGRHREERERERRERLAEAAEREARRERWRMCGLTSERGREGLSPPCSPQAR